VPPSEVTGSRKAVCENSLKLARVLQREAGKELVTPVFDRRCVRTAILEVLSAASRLDVAENDWRRTKRRDERDQQA